MADKSNELAALVRFTSFSSLTDLDLAALATLAGPARRIKRGEQLCSEGEAEPKLYLLLSGWTASTMQVGSGSRQIIKLHMPGDVLGLPSLALKHSADTVVALSKATVTPIALEALGAMFASHPRLAALLFLISLEERVVLMDRLASMGGNKAPGRIAALILELHARMRRHDPALRNAFNLPLNQREIGDLAGLATVHVNRTIQKLRRDQVISWERDQLTILDHEELRKLAGLPERELKKDQTWLPGPMPDA